MQQGKFHLLAIAIIPGFLMSLFLSSHWWIPVIYAIVSVIVIYAVLRVKKS